MNNPVEPSPATAATSELTVSVIICAYTMERWDLLNDAISSVSKQSYPCQELILCIDHNHGLYTRCLEDLAFYNSVFDGQFIVLENKYEGRLGSARTTASEVATGTVLAFLDDDAVASEDWLATLVAVYGERPAAAVGGRPIPRFEGKRPRWFPLECDWVFGCAYRGLPTKLMPVEHLIGANMSVRREMLNEIGGFHSDNHDDMDLSHRVAASAGREAVMYEPAALVHHFVPAGRLTWTYFWRRCFFVNKGKVEAFREMAEASNLNAELKFTGRAILNGFRSELGAILKGDLFGPVRYIVLLVAIALGGAGNLAGRLEGRSR
jgi:GT2 family glycosyltransferase